jgi:hypothetical protein
VLFQGNQVDYRLKNTTEIAGEQFGFFHQLEFCHIIYDPVSTWIQCFERFKILQHLQLKQIAAISMGCPFIFYCKHLSFSTFSYLLARKMTILLVKCFHF